MSDWFWDKGLFLLVLFIIGAVIAGFMWIAVFVATHVCTAYGQPYYHAPVYVKSGSVMVPVGGGVYPDCTEWKAKG